MINDPTHPRTTGRPWRDAAGALAIVAISFATTMAETSLRFVNAAGDAPATTLQNGGVARRANVSGERHSATASPEQSASSELRFLNSGGKAPSSTAAADIRIVIAPHEPAAVPAIPSQPITSELRLRETGDGASAPQTQASFAQRGSASATSPTIVSQLFSAAVEPAPSSGSEFRFIDQAAKASAPEARYVRAKQLEPAAEAWTSVEPVEDERVDVLEPQNDAPWLSVAATNNAAQAPEAPLTDVIRKQPPSEPSVISTAGMRTAAELFASPQAQVQLPKPQPQIAAAPEHFQPQPSQHTERVVVEPAQLAPRTLAIAKSDLAKVLQTQPDASQPTIAAAPPERVFAFQPPSASAPPPAPITPLPPKLVSPEMDLFAAASRVQPDVVKPPSAVASPQAQPLAPRPAPVKLPEPAPVAQRTAAPMASTLFAVTPRTEPDPPTSVIPEPLDQLPRPTGADAIVKLVESPRVAPPTPRRESPDLVSAAPKPTSLSVSTVPETAPPIVPPVVLVKPAPQPEAGLAKNDTRPAIAPLAPPNEVTLSIAPAESAEFELALLAGPQFIESFESLNKSLSLDERRVAAAPPAEQPTLAAPTYRTMHVDSIDPQPIEPKFQYVSAGERAPLLVPQQAPAATTIALSKTLPSQLPVEEALPCDCHQAPGPSCDCPYLPGQSGAPYVCGVDCGQPGAPCGATWNDAQCIPWSLFGPGEYVGPARPEHTSTYFLRVNDLITLTYIESRQKSAERYRLGVGDRLKIEWLQGASRTESPLDREVMVQPDGTVALPLVGEATAAGKTINDFQDEVTQLYSKFQREPQITVTPLDVNTAIQDILKAVIGRNTSAGQVQDLRVTPEGTIQAAGIGSVYVQGLTLDELRSELVARYAAAFGPGLLVSPALTERATSYVFLGGEVRAPGRYTLEGPTTVMQAIAMAGGWNNGGNTRQIIVFRRDEKWCLKATKINLRAPLYGKDPCPVNDIWLRDNDLVIVPKEKILCATDVIELYFTRGVYAVFPIAYVYDFSRNSAITPLP